MTDSANDVPQKRIVLTEEQFDALVSSTEPPPGASLFAIGCLTFVAGASFVLGFFVRGLLG